MAERVDASPVDNTVVGVLCMDIASTLRSICDSDITCYISASYVKYLEAAGALVMPICRQEMT
ncbi:GH15862 [Drosophila grimshawi]|uniref:GH15862 n=1 Tax=Drosophila grimshawi TaxID=7222 RepID=B4J0B6_DROGR|nr:GH15862 [Drosophila grimshawi]